MTTDSNADRQPLILTYSTPIDRADAVAEARYDDERQVAQVADNSRWVDALNSKVGWPETRHTDVNTETTDDD